MFLRDSNQHNTLNCILLLNTFLFVATYYSSVSIFCGCRYRGRIKEIASIIRDQPMTGLERAIWWTEYVIRHKGASHLKSPLAGMPWYQYFLLDVLAFVLIVGILIMYMLFVFVSIANSVVKSLEVWSKSKTLWVKRFMLWFVITCLMCCYILIKFPIMKSFLILNSFLHFQACRIKERIGRCRLHMIVKIGIDTNYTFSV